MSVFPLLFRSKWTAEQTKRLKIESGLYEVAHQKQNCEREGSTEKCREENESEREIRNIQTQVLQEKHQNLFEFP